MVKVQLSPDAVADLMQIKAYITNDLSNEPAALHTVAKITKRLHILEQFPQSGAPLSSIVDFASDYRFLVCGNYTAFYRYDHNQVFVLRILYGRRDFMRVLFKSEHEKQTVEPVAIEDMTKEQIDANLQKGMDDVKAGRVVSADVLEAEMKDLYGI